MKSATSVKLRIWVDKGDAPFIGPGRIELLQNIAKFGSISKAASEVNMSYRKAWQLINDMNAVSKKAIVEKRVGGSEGGGAVLTSKGTELVEKYLRLSKELDLFLSVNESLMEF